MGLIRSIKANILDPILRRVHPLLTLRVPAGQVRVDLRDRVIARLLYWDGDFEAEHRALMDCMTLEGGVCVDVGANIGLHTLTMARRVGPSGQVIAFEPEAHNFGLLEHNIKTNGLANVSLCQQACGATAGSCQLALNPHNFGDHRCQTGSPANGQRCQTVVVTTLDDALRDVSPGRVRLVKIDVQGWECEVLQGMQETLKRNPDLILLMEVFPAGLLQARRSATELIETLTRLGLGGWELGGRRIIPLGEPWTYELIRDGADIDVIVSRNAALLEKVLSDRYRYPTPVRPLPTAEPAISEVCSVPSF